MMCRHVGHAVRNREAQPVMRDHRLLQRPRSRTAEVYQVARLFDLLPQKPNDLWQMDVTYIHIPGSGWWYAVTAIDYYSRYLLTCHPTYRTEVRRGRNDTQWESPAAPRLFGRSETDSNRKLARTQIPCRLVTFCLKGGGDEITRLATIDSACPFCQACPPMRIRARARATALAFSTWSNSVIATRPCAPSSSCAAVLASQDRSR